MPSYQTVPKKEIILDKAEQRKAHEPIPLKMQLKGASDSIQLPSPSPDLRRSFPSLHSPGGGTSPARKGAREPLVALQEAQRGSGRRLLQATRTDQPGNSNAPKIALASPLNP